MRISTALGGLMTVAAVLPGGVRAQGLSAEFAAGRLVHQTASAVPGSNHLMGTVRYDTTRDAWVYGSAAVPVSEAATFWGGGGTGGRVLARLFSGASLGAEVGAHGYTFRDAVVDATGIGGTVEATPFVRISSGPAFAEGYGMWRGHTMRLGNVRDSRSVFETGARAGYHGVVHFEVDGKWVHGPEGTFPFFGARAAYDGDAWDVWGHAGKWMHDDLTATAWDAGLALALSGRSIVWARIGQQPPDPLYWNATRRAWTVGLTQRLGRILSPSRPIAVSESPAVSITVRATDAPAGPIFVAGDFNNWQPLPMRREGEYWVVQLLLASGFYHYYHHGIYGASGVRPIHCSQQNSDSANPW